MKAFLLILSFIFTAISAQAKIEVLFHPKDPTLEKIAQWISEAHSNIDIAMYNMDITMGSPVIQMIQSPAIQARLKSKDLRIRLIYEGYEEPADKIKRMTALEAMGIDVRRLGKSVKIHHKFAVIDSALPEARVVTGSANWSLSSYRNYNENILFFTGEDEVTARFQNEFNRLWLASKAFGQEQNDPVVNLPSVDEKEIDIFFNSPRTIDKTSTEETNLTGQVVRLIDEAQRKIQIATTRVRLVPVLEALHAAAERGVDVQVVISQDDFQDIGKRARYLLSSPKLQLRVKFYNLKVSDYMTFQMHNKFMLVDDQTILTGSFNWSLSSENNHIENLVQLSGQTAQEVFGSYQHEFDSIWDMGRDKLAPLSQVLTDLKSQGQSPRCAIVPMALSVNEIRSLLKLSPKCSAQ